MPAISSIFLSLALILAVLIGPQTRSWTWGPALLAMALALATAIPAIWRKRNSNWDLGLIIYGLIVAGWFGWRAWTSPVVEFAQADGLLLAGGVGAFVIMRAISGNVLAEKILSWSIALLLLANVLVVFKQVQDPTFSPLFRERASGFPSGFYAHYNEAANFLIACSFWVAATALFGKHVRWCRLILGLIAVGGLAAVYYTRSRGGILGAAAGTGVFAAGALMAGKRTGAKWFAPALIAFPLIGIIAGFFLYLGWHGAQEIRQGGGGPLMDNFSRLYILGVATSCIMLHPWTGGGSRSFSWECFRFFEGSAQGTAVTHLPEQVHNEMVQAATDYGLIGAGVLVGLLGGCVIIGVIRLLFSDARNDSPTDDAWRIGGLAALTGMFTQSCFSFVFHLFPGILLLGICLGKISRTSAEASGKTQQIGSKLLLSAIAISCITLIVPTGWKGTTVTSILWPTYFSKQPPVLPESAVDALTAALRIWPQSSLYKDQATLLQRALLREQPGSGSAAEEAISAYISAEKLHPFNPDFPVNLGILWSKQANDAKAEAAFARAIELQGGMEGSFRTHFLLANHLMAKGNRLYSAENSPSFLATMEEAAAEMEKAMVAMPWGTADMAIPRIAAQESLGLARELNGDFKGAMTAYTLATTFWGGGRAHYRIALLGWKKGNEVWQQRNPSLAMSYYMEARNRINLSAELPDGVTAEQRLALAQDLDKKIAFFKRTDTEPEPIPAE